jgi:hypothetical protein
MYCRKVRAEELVCGLVDVAVVYLSTSAEVRGAPVVPSHLEQLAALVLIKRIADDLAEEVDIAVSHGGGRVRWA